MLGRAAFHRSLMAGHDRYLCDVVCGSRVPQLGQGDVSDLRLFSYVCGVRRLR